MNLFVTLFLGLVAGSVSVEFDPPPETVRLEILVDGEPVSEIRAEPWLTDVDFGSRLQPHRLEVIARDSADNIVARDRQWVNLPTGQARAGIRAAKVDDGDALRLQWAHVLGYQPTQVRLAVDGEWLPVEDPDRVRLPPSEAELNLVRLEVEFPDFSIASADAVVRGGELIDEDVELTAIPVRRRDRDQVGEPLRGVRVDGREPELLALERGPAQIVMVVDPAAVEEFGVRLDAAAVERRENRADRGIEFVEDVSVLEGEDWVKFVWPMATDQHPTSGRIGTFDYSRDLTRTDGSLVEILRRTTPPTRVGVSDVRLADAVAVAGLLASSRSRRRAVILVVSGEDQQDSSLSRSRFSPREVHAYLGTLRVPLLVWTTAREHVRTTWGEARPLSTARDVERAIDELRRVVDRQRIAWIRGLYLPQEVTVADARAVGINRR